MICKFKRVAFFCAARFFSGEYMLEALLEALTDSLKLIPFLFLTYLAMGILERAASDKSKRIIKEAGVIGPIWGALLGAFPQCGFSAAASNFYVGRIITLGTLIAIYMSTSDEMLPIFLSEKVAGATILKIIAAKIVIGIISGFLVEIFFGWLAKKHKKPKDFDEKSHAEHCNCGAGVLMNAIGHTLQVFFFILIISAVISVLIYCVGEGAIYSFFSDIPVLGNFVAALVGLIPNCAASVVITQLYLDGIIGPGPMISGLLCSAGVGLLVLFKENKHIKENVTIVAILYVVSVAWGVLIELAGVTF